ncbi:hypothetical protein LTR84_002087 [Exophiala bonariae]|uniref:DUF4045 domain-containing protein n=1 Tax=Exophiala bonariae TaxID=1690606 RepID=A0AAV9NAD8_9EURO|nr:hypothetical protein LTR84_002087 [Exophiala bonariae]
MAASNGGLQRHSVKPGLTSVNHSTEKDVLGELSNSNDFNSRDNAPSSLTRIPAGYGQARDADKKERKPPQTIKQLREAAIGAAQDNTSRNVPKKKPEMGGKFPPVQQKKKPSLFGGLFQVKEPTQVALNQVAAQMIAQHGSTSPTKVPNVRLERMPEHVPKVNTKWDGVPDSVRRRDQREKEIVKGPMKDLFSLDVSRSGSSGREDDGRRRLNSRNSSSTTGSFSSRGRSVGSGGRTAHNRFYAQSVNSSGDLASQQRAERAKNDSTPAHSHSASTSSLPASATDTLPDIPDYLREAIVASRSNIKPDGGDDLEQNRKRTTVLMRPPEDAITRLKISQVPAVEDVPKHSISPLPSPHDFAPATPSSLQAGDAYNFRNRSPIVEHSTSMFPSPDSPESTSMPERKPPPIMTPGFLAGEAQELVLPDDESDQRTSDLPLRSWNSGRLDTSTTSASVRSRVQQDLEKRPDSSRARLGLRASMLVPDDQNPWEQIEQQALGAVSPRRPTSPRLVASPRGKFSKSFGIFNK